MPTYVALTYTADVDWSAPEQAEEMAEYGEFGRAAAAVIRGGNVLYPTATATTVKVRGGKGGDIVTSDGPYAETKEVLPASTCWTAPTWTRPSPSWPGCPQPGTAPSRSGR